MVAVQQVQLPCGPEQTRGLLTVPSGGCTPLKVCALIAIWSWTCVQWVQQPGGGSVVIHSITLWVMLVVFDGLLFPQWVLGTFWCITVLVGIHTTV